jgi:hypothetical protein
MVTSLDMKVVDVHVHIGEKNDNYSKDDIVAINQIIDALTTCKKCYAHKRR